jgi:hypothetical protein
LEDVNTVGGTVIEDGERDIIGVGVNQEDDPGDGIGTRRTPKPIPG